MPKISALIHVEDSERVLGRLLETLRGVDEIVVVGHNSKDGSQKVAKQYGAKWVEGVPGVSPGAYAADCSNDWVLCLLPHESVNEGLEAALHEWKSNDKVDAKKGYSLNVREQNNGTWKALGAETRLINRTCVNWTDRLPGEVTGAELIEGDVLRFAE